MHTPTRIEEIRLTNLRSLVAQVNGIIAEVGRISDVSAGYLSQILTRSRMENGKIREVGTKLARKLETGFNKPVGWMDQNHVDIDPRQKELLEIFGELNDNMKVALLEHARLYGRKRK